MASKNKALSAAVEIFDQEIEGVIRKIPLKSIEPAKVQPRQNKDINIKTLAASLQENGLLQPIIVTRHEGKYTIIAGERRYHAARLIGWMDIECRILNKNEEEAYKLAIIENLQRENLDSLEESIAYKRLKEQFSYTDSELSEIIGKSRNYISEILSIAEIPVPLLEKARGEGINSKNLLIQFALAVKKGIPHKFIEEFKQGNISSVKSAKGYLQDATKPESFENFPGPPKSPTQKKDALGASVNNDLDIKVSKNREESTLLIKIKTPQVKLDRISIDSIQKDLQGFLQPIIDKANS